MPRSDSLKAVPAGFWAMAKTLAPRARGRTESEKRRCRPAVIGPTRARCFEKLERILIRLGLDAEDADMLEVRRERQK